MRTTRVKGGFSKFLNGGKLKKQSVVPTEGKDCFNVNVCWWTITWQSRIRWASGHVCHLIFDHFINGHVLLFFFALFHFHGQPEERSIKGNNG